MKEERSTASLALVAGSLAQKLNINVIFLRDDTAYCGIDSNGKYTIALPYTDNPDLGNVLLGYLLHEAGHAKYTNFDVCKQTGNSYLDSFENICEDIWLEHKLELTYAGAKLYLDSVRSHVFSDNGDWDIQDLGDLIALFIQTTLYSGRKMHNKLALDIDKTIDLFKKHFSEDVFDELQKLLGKVINSLTTKDNVEIAKSIYNLMVSSLKDKLKENQSDDSQQSDAYDGFDNSDKSKSLTESFDEVLNKISPSDVFSNITKDISERMKELSDTVGLLGDEMDNPYRRVPFNITQFDPHSNIKGEELNKQTISQSLQSGTRLRRTFSKLVQDNNKSRRRLKDSGSRIQSTKLAGVRTGATNIFINKAVQVTPNCTCSILFDISGSMNVVDKRNKTTLLNIALRSLITVIAGLNINGVSTACYSFPYYHADRGGFATGDPMVLKMKGRNESLLQCLAKGTFCLAAQGRTPLGEALIPVITETSLAKQKKKIIFVITDGEPDDVSVAKKSYEIANSQGIEVIYLIFLPSEKDKDITEKMIKQFTSNFVMITDFNQIEETIINYCEKYINNTL